MKNDQQNDGTTNQGDGASTAEANDTTAAPGNAAATGRIKGAVPVEGQLLEHGFIVSSTNRL